MKKERKTYLTIATVVLLFVFILYILLNNNSTHLPYDDNGQSEDVFAYINYTNGIHNLESTTFTVKITNGGTENLEINEGTVMLDFNILGMSNQEICNWSKSIHLQSKFWIEPDSSIAFNDTVNMQELALLLTDDEYQLYATCTTYDHSDNIQIFTTEIKTFHIY